MTPEEFMQIAQLRGAEPGPVTVNPNLLRQGFEARQLREGRRMPLGEILGGFGEGFNEDPDALGADRLVGVMDPANTELREAAREAGRIGNVLQWIPGSPTAIAKGLMAGGGKALNLAIMAATLKQGLKGEPGFAYHATNAERLREIADSGKLRTHKPNYGTDQDMWPDASTEKRAYFGASPENLYQFAPEEGRGVVVRTKHDGRIFRESTGDLFARKPMDAKSLEFLGVDDKWHPLSELTDR